MIAGIIIAVELIVLIGIWNDLVINHLDNIKNSYSITHTN